MLFSQLLVQQESCETWWNGLEKDAKGAPATILTVATSWSRIAETPSPSPSCPSPDPSCLRNSPPHRRFAQ
ncbi:hypothetical protein GCM10010389_05900 [Streptomyces echinoruber]|uniref:Uncharacterized protein n=1 Tax=Streptomyces echinoruber TaxID=68898 RepID=A0A918QSR0_9ACTN|nr:hypothetical protein GCM10010389_05900 [Streptomyces echinoruber]